MAEGGRIEPGRHARPRAETTELRQLVEQGAYQGRHEAAESVQVADGMFPWSVQYDWGDGLDRPGERTIEDTDGD